MQRRLALNLWVWGGLVLKSYLELGIRNGLEGNKAETKETS